MSAVAAQDEPSTAHQFLANLYDGTEAGWLNIFAVDRTTGTKPIRWRPVADLAGLAADAAQLEPSCCVWWSVAPRRTKVTGRGGDADCATIPALWLDVDVAGPTHAHGNLPPDLEAAKTLIRTYPIGPTAVINTGGGLQAFWKFAEPVPAAEAEGLLRRWGATWAEYARRHDWHIDNVFDLSRVMRLPGTTNRKADPVPVTVMFENWSRCYGVDDLDHWLIDPPAVKPTDKSRHVPYIGPERPGDAFNASADPGKLLEKAGWKFEDTDTDGNDHYQAPHRIGTKGSTGATVYTDGHTTIWSETFAAERGMSTRRPYDAFGLYAHLFHGGDFTAATVELEAQGYGSRAVTDLVWIPPLVEAGDDEPWPDPIPLGGSHVITPFPLWCLPEWIANHAQAVAAELQVAVDLPAMLGLASLSAARAGHDVVHVKNTWHEPVNLYLVTALPPGAGKSPAVKAVTRPLVDAEVLARDDVESRRKFVELERRMVEQQLAKAEKAGDITTAKQCLLDLERDEMQVPVLPRYIADDATPEALAKLLYEQRGRMALISTEGGPFEMMTGRYSERANLEVYLQAWSGDTIRIDRIGRGEVYISDPVLTVCLTVQPSVIQDLSKRPELAGRGLTARFMYAVPQDFVGQRNLVDEQVSDPAIRVAYERHMAALVAPGRSPAPRVIAMTTEARRAFLMWRQELEDRRTPSGDLRPLAEWTTKLESSVARVAGLLAVADGGDVIDAGVMERALAIGAYWLDHAKIVHDLWGADEMVRLGRQVLTWIRERQVEKFTMRDLYRAMSHAFPTAADAISVLTFLTERGYLRPLFDGPLSVVGRGKASPTFAVHLTCLTHSVEPCGKPENVSGMSGVSGACQESKTDLTHSLTTKTREQGTSDMTDMPDTSVAAPPEVPQPPTTTGSGETVPAYLAYEAPF